MFPVTSLRWVDASAAKRGAGGQRGRGRPPCVNGRGGSIRREDKVLLNSEVSVN